MIKDAGKTEIPAGTITVCAIGPGKVLFAFLTFWMMFLGDESEIDKVTGEL